jgi:hypothetical protein
MKNTPSRTARTPNGLVDSTKPIALRLSMDERTEIERIAEQDHRAMATVCRLLMLRGLEAFKRDPKHRLVR